MADFSREGNSDLDDWESLDDNGAIEKQLAELQKMKEKNSEDSAGFPGNGLQFGKVKILQNDANRTPYQPQIKILKREPPENGSCTSSSSGMGEKKPSVLSLQEREAAYAEVRKRIMGSANDQNSDSSSSSLEASPNMSRRTIIVPTHSGDRAVIRQPIGPSSGQAFRQRDSYNT